MLKLQADSFPLYKRQSNVFNESTFADKLLSKGVEISKRNVIALKEMLMRASALVLEANYLAAEMQLDAIFSVKLQILPENIKLTRSINEPRCAPVICVRQKSSDGVCTLTVEKFENRLVEMREKYSDFSMRNGLFTHENSDGFYDIFSEVRGGHELIGVANIFMSCLLYDVRFCYLAPIINEHGQVMGKIYVELQRINGVGFYEKTVKEEDDHTGNDPHLLVKVSIKDVRGIPSSLANFVFCQFRFWSQSETIVVPPKMIKDPKQCAKLRKKQILLFDYEATFRIKATRGFTDYCLNNGSFSIEVYGHRAKRYKNSLSDNDEEDKKMLVKLASLWNEVKCLLVVWIEIQELTEAGIWSPAHLVQDVMAPAVGGVFKIRQGQSNRIVVHVRRIKNASSLPIIIEKISSIEVGSVRCCKPPVSLHLDSYQEDDLNILRNYWLDVVAQRRLYLENELKSLESRKDTKNDSYAKERENYLINQLIGLTDERNAIEIPLPGSGIPGAPADWTPPVGMEKHIPIIFLNLDNTEPSKIDTRILEEDINDEYFSLPLIFSTEDSACAQWDPSVHESSAFNHITPNDSFVFIIVKIAINILEPVKTTIVLRKRVALQVIRRVSNWSDRFIKRILGGDERNLRTVGVTYEIISHLPFELHESESRESLAKLAAAPDTSNLFYIEQYLKAVQTLDAVLRFDQLRQEIVLREILRHDNNIKKYLSTQDLNSPMEGANSVVCVYVQFLT